MKPQAKEHGAQYGQVLQLHRFYNEWSKKDRERQKILQVGG